jgi:hypothetical protein
MKMNYLTVTLALAMLAFAPKSSWGELVVTVDGNTVTAIQDLPVNGIRYDVAFLLTNSNNLYGESPNFTFDFTNADDASFAMGRIIEVIDNNSAITHAGMSSTTNSQSMFIGYQDAGVPALHIDARHGRYSNQSLRWLNEGVENLGYDEPRIYADFTEVVSEPTPGDANGDGKVDGLDYLIWAGAFGDDPAADPPGSPENGDFNDDGIVDGLDYLAWAGNFGQGPNDGVAVPEPGALTLATIALLAMCCRRRRRA